MLNNPINASDPSGHKCVGEPEECLSSSGVARGGFTGGASGYKGSGWVKPKDTGGGDDNEPKLPSWDPKFDIKKDDKEKAEAAFLSLLQDPDRFAEYYVNPSAAPEEYTYLELFAQYSELHMTADQLIFLVVADKYGLETAGELDPARILNNVKLWSGQDEEVTTFSAIIIPIDPKIYAYSLPPGPGWQWRGDPTLGAWYNKTTNEYLRVDYTHHGEMHYDYRAPDGLLYRVFMDGRIEPK